MAHYQSRVLTQPRTQYGPGRLHQLDSFDPKHPGDQTRPSVTLLHELSVMGLTWFKDYLTGQGVAVVTNPGVDDNALTPLVAAAFREGIRYFPNATLVTDSKETAKAFSGTPGIKTYVPRSSRDSQFPSSAPASAPGLNKDQLKKDALDVVTQHLGKAVQNVADIAANVVKQVGAGASTKDALQSAGSDVKNVVLHAAADVLDTAAAQLSKKTPPAPALSPEPEPAPTPKPTSSTKPTPAPKATSSTKPSPAPAPAPKATSSTRKKGTKNKSNAVVWHETPTPEPTPQAKTKLQTVLDDATNKVHEALNLFNKITDLKHADVKDPNTIGEVISVGKEVNDFMNKPSPLMDVINPIVASTPAFADVFVDHKPQANRTETQNGATEDREEEGPDNEVYNLDFTKDLRGKGSGVFASAKYALQPMGRLTAEESNIAERMALLGSAINEDAAYEPFMESSAMDGWARTYDDPYLFELSRDVGNHEEIEIHIKPGTNTMLNSLQQMQIVSGVPHDTISGYNAIKESVADRLGAYQTRIQGKNRLLGPEMRIVGFDKGGFMAHAIGQDLGIPQFTINALMPVTGETLKGGSVPAKATYIHDSPNGLLTLMNASNIKDGVELNYLPDHTKTGTSVPSLFKGSLEKFVDPQQRFTRTPLFEKMLEAAKKVTPEQPMTDKARAALARKYVTARNDGILKRFQIADAMKEAINRGESFQKFFEDNQNGLFEKYTMNQNARTGKELVTIGMVPGGNYQGVRDAMSEHAGTPDHEFVNLWREMGGIFDNRERIGTRSRTIMEKSRKGKLISPDKMQTGELQSVTRELPELVYGVDTLNQAGLNDFLRKTPEQRQKFLQDMQHDQTMTNAYNKYTGENPTSFAEALSRKIGAVLPSPSGLIAGVGGAVAAHEFMEQVGHIFGDSDLGRIAYSTVEGFFAGVTSNRLLAAVGIGSPFVHEVVAATLGYCLGTVTYMAAKKLGDTSTLEKAKQTELNSMFYSNFMQGAGSALAFLGMLYLLPVELGAAAMGTGALAAAGVAATGLSLLGAEAMYLYDPMGIKSGGIPEGFQEAAKEEYMRSIQDRHTEVASTYKYTHENLPADVLAFQSHSLFDL